VMDPRLHCARESLAGIVLTLEALAREDRPLSALIARLPQYAMEKARVELAEPERLALPGKLERLGATPPAGWRVDRTDGLKFIGADEWVHLRASNTEPILRIIAESPTRERTSALVREYREKLAAT